MREISFWANPDPTPNLDPGSTTTHKRLADMEDKEKVKEWNDSYGKKGMLYRHSIHIHHTFILDGKKDKCWNID